MSDATKPARGTLTATPASTARAPGAAGPHGVADDLKAMLAGYSLTTAEILYRLPDHPALIQSYIWQDFDVSPRFPRLEAFLAFWSRTLDGPLFKVTVAHRALIKPAELRLVGAELHWH